MLLTEICGMSSRRTEDYVDLRMAPDGVVVDGVHCRRWCEVADALADRVDVVLYSERVVDLVKKMAPVLAETPGIAMAGETQVEWDRMRVVIRAPSVIRTLHDTSRIAEAGAEGSDTLPALRRAAAAAGLAARGLSSPTAISSSILRESGVEWRDPWADHARRAYYGGRFQCGSIGHFLGPVYRYDIRAAYLSALIRLPSPGGRWITTERPMRRWPEHSWWYGRIKWAGERGAVWSPFPVRVTGGVEWGQTAQVYPSRAEGWYPADIIRSSDLRPADVSEWCEYVPPDDHHPLEKPLIRAYAARQQLRRTDPAAAAVLKAAINAVYGKLCQVNGKSADRWRNFGAAGWCTAHTASLLWRAISPHADHVISVLTDGLISRRPLGIDLRDEPGGWVHEATYDELFVARASAYWERRGSEWSCHWAGQRAQTLERAPIMEHWKKFGPHKKCDLRGVGELLRPEWGTIGWYAEETPGGGNVRWTPPSWEELDGRRWEYDALGERVGEGRGGI